MLAGISADRPEETRAWQAEEEPADRLGFPLLSDPDLAACKAFGVHDAAHGVALPAVVVVHARDGTVRWTRVGESITDRPALDELLEVVRGLGPPR
ncbi:MAG: redoxin domain-containing protein [Planctomycetes bacterium]|nr:redoxin domain-containing protein [Planctomycetota bacterium]